MTETQDTPKASYFLCGIGGSGMLPLALILKARGYDVEGSDRSLDAGRTSSKFDFLRAHGIALFPQDGSGIAGPDTILVTSAAVEETIPDVQAARRVGATLMLRAELLSQLFNEAPNAIGVAECGPGRGRVHLQQRGLRCHAAALVGGARLHQPVRPQVCG